MDENDGIAGRYEHDFVGFSSQVGGIYTYYFNEHEFLNAYMACKQNGEITAAEDYALQAVQAYWHEENTARKVELEFSKRYGYVPPKAFPGAGVGNCDCRVAGTNLDFEKLIRQYDRPVSFFYCDPPYFATENYYKDVGFTKADHIRLRDTLLQISGKFLVSYNDCPEIRDLWNRPGIAIEEISRLNNLVQRYEGGCMYNELLISNYDTSERAKMTRQLSLF